MEDNMSDMINNMKKMIDSGNLPNDLQNMINNISSNNSNASTHSTNINNSNNIDLADMLKNIPPDLMNNLSSMMNSNKSENSETSSQNNQNNFNIDINTMLKMKSIIENMNNKNDPRANLLYSLKPYLRENKKDKLDQYVNLLNMAKVADIMKTETNTNKK